MIRIRNTRIQLCQVKNLLDPQYSWGCVAKLVKIFFQMRFRLVPVLWSLSVVTITCLWFFCIYSPLGPGFLHYFVEMGHVLGFLLTHILFKFVRTRGFVRCRSCYADGSSPAPVSKGLAVLVLTKFLRNLIIVMKTKTTLSNMQMCELLLNFLSDKTQSYLQKIVFANINFFSKP